MTISDSAQRIWDDVQVNTKRLNGCPKHFFVGGATVGVKKVCAHCEGSMRLTDIGQYIRGYVAHGGEATDIWPEWE